MTICMRMCWISPKRSKARILKSLKLTVSIGVGAIRQGYRGIAVSYQEAMELLQYRSLIGQEIVIPIDRINLGDASEFLSILDDYAERLTMADRYGE